MSERFQEFKTHLGACAEFKAKVDSHNSDWCARCDQHREHHVPDMEITLDLDSIISFERHHRYPEDSIIVHSETGFAPVLRCTYADFKKLHKAYHDSKLPTINIPSSWTDPTVNVKSTLTTTSTGEWTSAEIAEERLKLEKELATYNKVQKKPKKR